MAILTKIIGEEFYLYMNGNLIYKRWLDTGVSKVFDVMAYDKYTISSIRDLEYELHLGEVIVEAKLKLKSTEDGGRVKGIISGYRPNHVFEYNGENKLHQTYIGDIIFDDQPTIEPGEEKIVTVRFLLSQHIEQYLNKGRKWWIYEAGVCLGEAEIIEFYSN